MQSTASGEHCPEVLNSPTLLPSDLIIISPTKYNDPNQKEKLRPNNGLPPLEIPTAESFEVSFIFPEKPGGTLVEKVIILKPETSNLRRVKIFKQTPTLTDTITPNEIEWVPFESDIAVYDATHPIIFPTHNYVNAIKLVIDDPMDAAKYYNLKLKMHACITLNIPTTTLLSTVPEMSPSTSSVTQVTETQTTPMETITTTYVTSISTATVTSSKPGMYCPEDMENPTLITADMIQLTPSKYNVASLKRRLRPSDEMPLEVPVSDNPDITISFPDDVNGTPLEKIEIPKPSNVKTLEIFVKRPATLQVATPSETQSAEGEWELMKNPTNSSTFDASAPIIFSPPVQVSALKIVPKEPEEISEDFKLKLKCYACLRISLSTTTTTTTIQPTTNEVTSIRPAPGTSTIDTTIQSSITTGKILKKGFVYIKSSI